MSWFLGDDRGKTTFKQTINTTVSLKKIWNWRHWNILPWPLYNRYGHFLWHFQALALHFSYVILFIDELSCAVTFQTRNTELDKIKRELEEVKKDKQSLEEARSWLERRLTETEVMSQNPQWFSLDCPVRLHSLVKDSHSTCIWHHNLCKDLL